MQLNEKKKTLYWNVALVIVGFILSAVVLFVMGISLLNHTETFTRSTTQTLVQQCQTFDDIQSVSREKNLFSMNENLTSLNSTVQPGPNSVLQGAFIGLLIFVLLCISGFLIGIAFKSRDDRARRRMLEESNTKLTESASIMKSLESVYFTIFFVDLKKNTYRSLIIAPWMKNIVEESGEFASSAQKLISCVLPEYQDEIRKRLEYDYIYSHLKRDKDSNLTNCYYIDYEANRGEKTVWCRITFTAVDFDEDKKPSQILVMIQDVDREKSKEVNYQKRILQEADLAQAANRAKTTFLFNVSHDMRTPINAILGYSNLAKSCMGDTEKLNKYLTNIHVSGERMLSLINEVLELARIENGKVVINEKAVRAGEGMQSCVVIVKPTADEKDISINFTTNITHPYLFVDPSNMSRIALNLLNNAVKYTNNGGHIDCTLNQKPCEKEGYCITEIIVSDNGIGMSDEFLPHIFEMFARERNTTVSGISGTGLGLGVVKSLVDMMNGTVDVKSKAGVGSTFTVRIPHRIAKESDAEVVEVQYHVQQDSVKDKRVLLAEDGDMNAEIIMEIMQTEGLSVDRAKDGEECLKLLENAPDGYYDMILMDIQMPNMDGYTATSEIRKNGNPKKAGIPIVAMTANAFPEDKQRSIDAGMNGHLAKPIDIKELMLIFEKYLGAELIYSKNVRNSEKGV